MKKITLNLSVLLLLTLLLGSGLEAQGNEAPKPDAGSETVAVVVPISENKGPEDALNRGTPRSSAIGFLEACSQFNFARAGEFLDLRNLPKDVHELGGAELARMLNHVLSRTVWLDDYNVSDHPEGARGDGLPEYRDELIRVPVEDDSVPIWMQRVPRGDGEQIWKISNRTVTRIPELYEEYSYSPPVERIRRWFPEDASLLGIEAFKWFIILAFALVSWPVYYLLALLLTRILSSPKNETYPLVRKVLTGPVVMLAILLTAGTVLERLGAGAYAQMVMKAQTLVTIAIVWGLWSIINLFKKFKQAKLIENDRPGAAKLLQPMTTLLKIMIFIFGLLFWLNNVGFNITTVLAGLGVGGLAVALALQKPIEDMMGALTIFSQASIRVGDLARYGTELGVVEDIGLRTTRLRTLTNTVVSIPNSRIAYLEVENMSYREKIRYYPTLRLRYDIRTEQITEIRDNIQSLLENNERVHDDPVRVRFTDFNDDAILIKIHSFLKTTDFSEALEIGEDLNLEVMRIVEAAGARFALPGISNYIEGESSSIKA